MAKKSPIFAKKSPIFASGKIRALFENRRIFRMSDLNTFLMNISRPFQLELTRETKSGGCVLACMSLLVLSFSLLTFGNIEIFTLCYCEFQGVICIHFCYGNR